MNASFAYFQRTLRKTLNYFCQQRIINGINSSIVDKIHYSYMSLFVTLEPDDEEKKSYTQDDLRDAYEKTFDSKTNPRPEVKIVLSPHHLVTLEDDLMENEDDEFDTYLDQVDDFDSSECESHEDAMSDRNLNKVQVSRFFYRQQFLYDSSYESCSYFILV